MLDKIIPSNARTQTIEYAVDALSKRESLTMNDVREYLDVFTQTKIDTGKKKQVHVTDPDTGEVLETREYPVMEPIAKFYSYRTDEKEIYMEAVQKRLNNKDFKLDLQTDGKLSDMLKELKSTAFFVAREDIKSFVQWAVLFGQDIQNTCKVGVPSKNVGWKKLNLVFDSTQMGCGKSFFELGLLKGAKSLGICVPDARETPLPLGGFYNHKDESEYLLVVHQEHRDQKIDMDTLKQIARREPYPYTEKGKEQITLPGRAIMLGSTNGYNYVGADPRGFRTIRCLPYDAETIFKYAASENPEFLENLEKIGKMSDDLIPYITKIYTTCYNFSWISRFLDKLLTKENNVNNIKDFSAENREIHEILRKFDTSYLLLDVLNEITGEKELLYSISTAALGKLYKRYSGRDLTFNQLNAIATLLQQLFRTGIISKRNYESRDFYVKYDLSNIMNIKTADLSEDVNLTMEKEITDAMKEWDRIIQLALDFENGNPEPSKEKFLKPTEDKLPDLDGWSFGEKYDTEFTEVNLGQQQVCVNKTKGKTANRTNEGVEGCNYLCECDDISKGEQMEYVEKLPQEVKDAIIWVCDSGGKSIHVVLKTASNCNGKEREYILKKLSDKYFGGHLDMSAKNASRLCRNPNAMRDNGMKQQCLYMNLNPKPLDISEWKFEIDKKMEEKEEERKLSNSMRFINSSNTSKEYSTNTLDKLKDWYNRKPTDMKADCIAFLEGRLKDWNKGVACVRALRNYGFTDADIESEGPANDTWIKQSIKGAR